jgi:hypothetical protein
MYAKTLRHNDYFKDLIMIDSDFYGKVFTLDSYLCENMEELQIMRYLISKILITTEKIDLSIYKEFELADDKNGFFFYKRTKSKRVSLYWIWQNTFQIFYIKTFLSMIENSLYISDDKNENTDIEFVFYPSKIIKE